MEQNFYEILEGLKNGLKEAIDKGNETIADLTIMEEQYRALECEKEELEKENENLIHQINNLKDVLSNERCKGDSLETLKEIIDMAEMEDYGVKRWRNLATKQDLINAIVKEVL